jgi:hypothetical protein
VRRCFAAWLVLARERWWKTQMSSMESQVALLEAKVRGYEKRPIQVRSVCSAAGAGCLALPAGASLPACRQLQPELMTGMTTGMT